MVPQEARPQAVGAPEGSLFLSLQASGSIVFAVAVALAVTLLDTGWSPGFALRAAGVCLLYLVLAIGVGDGLGTERSLVGRLLYFAIQLAVLALLALVFHRRGVFGGIWLCYMPLVAQARMALPLWGTAGVVLGSLGIMMTHVGTMAGWGSVPSSLFAISAAMIFVLIFTEIAIKASEARAESQRLSEQLEKANRRLGDYAVQAEELAAARERARMAREIHDSVGHSLTAVHMQIEAARTMLDRDLPKARGALDKAQQCVRDGLADIRSSVGALRADPLEGRNLHGALADLADLSESAGLPVTLRITGRQRPISEAVTLALFRCAQEGLTNAKKHARARRVDVELDYGGTGETPRAEDRVWLRISDDGRGSEGGEGGFGLLGLEERLRPLGGSLEVTSKPGEGFSLEIEIPTPTPAV